MRGSLWGILRGWFVVAWSVCVERLQLTSLHDEADETTGFSWQLTKSKQWWTDPADWFVQNLSPSLTDIWPGSYLIADGWNSSHTTAPLLTGCIVPYYCCLPLTCHLFLITTHHPVSQIITTRSPNSVMAAIIIADSRGRGLQKLLTTSTSNFKIEVLVHPGAGSELAVLRSLTQLRAILPCQILMLTGICDLTSRNRATRQVNLKSNEVNINVDRVMGAIQTAYELLTALGATNISFATITGVDLSDCNHPPRRHMTSMEYLAYCDTTKIIHPDQLILNQSILEINKQIVIFNRKNSARTIWIAGLVHSYYKNKHHHCYKKLFDGCHPDIKTKQAWAAQIAKTLKRIAPLLPVTPTL